jgi:AAA15 family ATPase/GTPase
MMLITIRIANFLSFNEEVEFSMLAGQQRLLPTHLVSMGKDRDAIDILKTAVIYGANASGKSNLIKAVDFARKIIVHGVKSEAAHHKHFRLDPENLSKPSKFEFEFKIEEKIYAYGFSMLLETKKILAEWLFEVQKNSDKPVFERTVLENGSSKIAIHLKLDKKTKTRFEVYTQDVLENQLFLTILNEKNLKNINLFKAVYHWFEWHLIVIKNNNFDNMMLGLTGFIPFKNQDLEKYFDLFNTGITKIVTKSLPIEQIEWLIKTFHLDKLIETWKMNPEIPLNVIQPFVFWLDGKQYRFAIAKNEKNEIQFTQLTVLTSSIQKNQPIEFEMDDLSDGTQRLLDLLPFLNRLEQSNYTVLIDEIDRSLHPELTHKLIAFFHLLTQNIESQLIMTTHESNLLDLALLRRDEIWFVEKNEKGESDLYSLEKFKPRHDAELRKAYLLGRFGAIPSISNPKILGWQQQTELQTPL